MMNVYEREHAAGEENDRLLNWQAVARKLETENHGLREIAHFA